MIEKSNILHDRKIAILATDGFDESQLFSPKKALEEAGAEVIIVSLKEGQIKGWTADHWGKSINVDATVNNSTSDDFDGLVIPGGEKNPESLCHNKNAVEFVKDFINEGKSVAFICHGSQVLLESGLSKGRTLTSWPTLKNKFIQSGANWKDDEVVVHKGIISSQCPYDNPKFNKKMIEGFSISPRCNKSSLH